MTPKLTVFGEVLWDVLPDTRLAGGATMNVAAHLERYGTDVSFVSRVGHDELGAELLAFMEGHGLSTAFVQTGETHLTGIAKANVSDSHEVTYKILYPVAWDYIQFDNLAAERIEASDYFVYGSLAARDNITRGTLLRYLQVARTPVFDVNLRPPHYTREGVLELLAFGRIVKMNEHELAEVAGWLGDFAGEREAMALVMGRYKLEMLVLTCGEHGATILTADGQYHQHSGFEVQVADTIGSGDAFLGALLYKIATGHSVSDALEFACAAGAFVAGKTGALPVFTESDITAMIRKQMPVGQVI